MSLLKGASVYFSANILSALIPFLLLPILTRYLSPDEYGQIAMFQILLSVLGVLVGFNVIGAASRKYYDGDVDNLILRQFNGSCLQILLITNAISFIVVMLFKHKISEFLGIPSNWIFSAILISASSFIVSMRLSQWQIRSKMQSFGVFQVTNSLINMLLSLLLVVILVQGAQGRIEAQLITCFITGIAAYILLYKDKLIDIKSFKPEYIKEALSFGIPLIPHNVGGLLILFASRIVINEQLSLFDVGIYMVAFQLSTTMSVVFDALNKAYVPWLFERLKRDNYEEKKQIVKYTYCYFVALLLISGIIFLIGPFFITLIAGDKYSEAGTLIGLLCLGQAFGGMYLMVTNYMFFSKKTGMLSLVTIIAGLINVFLLFIFVKHFGLIGAAISFSIARLIQFLSTWFMASNFTDMPWKLR